MTVMIVSIFEYVEPRYPLMVDLVVLMIYRL